MTWRILIAGVIGGLSVFVTGAVEHMVLQWGDRSVQRLPDEAALQSVVTAQKLAHGIYGFPEIPGDVPADQQETADTQLNERYKQGPNGMLFIGRSGEDMMGPRQLGMEAGSNILACLLAAWVVSRFSPKNGFLIRWLAVMTMGAMAWLSLSASHAIWYRFHWPFVRDELLGILLEGAVAGLVVAAIVKPVPDSANTAAATTL